MPTIIFVENGGEMHGVTAKVGESVMQAATRSGVRGIIGECGGSCMCATCHCYVDPATSHVLTPAAATELETLEFVAVNVRPESRLTCQVKVTDELEGLVLTVATQ